MKARAQARPGCASRAGRGDKLARRVQFEPGVPDIAQALLRVLFETTLDEPPHRRGNIAQVRPFLHHSRQRLREILALEQALARDISYSTTPNAQMSARLSTGLPRACSGDMYAAVPRMTPACVAAMLTVGEASELAAAAASATFANPKSRTFTVPSGLILTLPGFRSRCTAA